MSLSCVFIPFADAAKKLEIFSFEGTNEIAQKILTNLGPNVKLTPLLRHGNGVEGLYAYSVPYNYAADETSTPNIRATRLAMACGLLSLRFWGDVILVRSNGCVIAANEGKSIPDKGMCQSLTLKEIEGACLVSPDLRAAIQKELRKPVDKEPLSEELPEWLRNAAQNNYHDAGYLARLAAVMTPTIDSDESDDAGDGASKDESSSSDSDGSSGTEENKNESRNNFVAKCSLCLHCRGPTSALCPGCEGAYFCEEPRRCRAISWSHQCLCRTWKSYADHREKLSSFPFDDWHLQLTTREFQTSEDPYRVFLANTLGVSLEDGTSWWTTEVGGWSGGQSESAQTIDPFVRSSFLEGFAPVIDVPPEHPVREEDLERCMKHPVTKNQCGLLQLSSWNQYYELRGIPLSSPAALLLTFPLSLYYAIAKYGEVPVTVARMLKRPLRIHVVGVEKEMNFLDIFKEFALLLPQDLEVELIFVVRGDMLPPKCRSHQSTKGYSMNVELTEKVNLLVVSGTYGDSLDPNFDCGSGSPDMVIGLNAGLFAYESWRSVVSFLYHHEGVVGVFTDYNEHSGVNCASLGGGKARESLAINPFRQPLSLPVYCMNLPQMSNGFTYVFNEQELDM